TADSLDIRAGASRRLPGLLSRIRGGRSARPRSFGSAAQSFTVTFVAVVILAAFLSPLLRSFTVSIKSPEQNSQVGGPLLPSSPATFNYRGRDFSMYEIPFPDNTTRKLALIQKNRTSSQFMNPKNASQTLVTWNGQ